MAERIAEKTAQDAGLTQVRFTSAATSTDEIGQPIDPRAVRVLKQGGYRTSNHRAHQITAQEIHQADLVVAMEMVHLNRMERIAPEADNIVLLTDFDPDATPGSGIEDPWYGPQSGFEITRTAIERAMPALLDWVRDRG
jgi:protein-tyrosine phosphatase